MLIKNKATTSNSEKGKSIVEDHGSTKIDKIKKWYLLNSRRNTTAIILVLILVLFAFPTTRYSLLSLLIKKDISIIVMDERFNLPVSGAEVTLEEESVESSAEGVVNFSSVGVGEKIITIKKPHYDNTEFRVLISLHYGLKTKLKIRPNGKLAPVIVIDDASGMPVAGAKLSVADTFVVTNGRGEAYISLADELDNKGVLAAQGYKSKSVSIVFSHLAFKQNTFTLQKE